MDLDVVGRHALLFDDDALAAFVNSGDALVEWHSLQIDRYDVRHLLSAPPPPRRRNRSSEAILIDDPSLLAQLDHERYLDLPSPSDEPEVKEDYSQSSTSGFHAVSFSYGDPADEKNAAAGVEVSGFVPPFPIPGNLVPSLPPTEKVHQIIARTALFVSKHGGQSEIILRVKQGDNPTFGFLMPDHHLHAYFRFLVEHPELLHSEPDEKSQNEGKMADSENQNGAGGALSLLGSVYGSGEEEDTNDNPNTEVVVSQDDLKAVSSVTSNGSKKIGSKADAAKDEPVSRSTILSNKEKVLTVKKNTLLTGSKSGNVKSSKKEEKSGLTSAEKAKSSAMAVASKFEPLILEPPSELKKLIDKVVEFISRNGRQFEATLIEQDRKHGRFPFLLQSNPYHSYYLKVLQTAGESKVNGKTSSSEKDGIVKIGKDRKASILKEKESYLSDACDMPAESDRKEKFKMVIGKSKEVQEKESIGSKKESGIIVDAAAAAAILQAATRGIKTSSLRTFSNATSLRGQLDSSDGGDPATSFGHPAPGPDNIVEKMEKYGSQDISSVGLDATARRADREPSVDVDSSEAHLTEEQKLKAERLRRAKMFVAKLKSGEVPLKTGSFRGSSVEPVESEVARSGDKADHNVEEREGSVATADFKSTATDEKPERTGERAFAGEENIDRIFKRKYRSRSGECDDGDDDDEDDNEDKKDKNYRRYRSRSRRYEDDEDEHAVEKEHKRSRRNGSDSEENEDKRESDENQDDRHSKKKHRSHHSSRERSRKRRSSKHLHEKDGDDDEDERDHKRSRKKHRRHHSSRHSRDRHRRRSRHSSRDKESRHSHKHASSSDDEHHDVSSLDKHKKDSYYKDELEEGEISSRVSEESRGPVSGHVSREASVDLLNSNQRRASSQPSETNAEVPNDLRAKIRAMLMATHS